jgi:diguanylate cyclase (GGDEF)-like protein/PAS domain S-box-containing protein
MDTPPATNVGPDAAAAAPARGVASVLRFGAARLARGQQFGMAVLGAMLATTLGLELVRHFAPESLANVFGMTAETVERFARGATLALLAVGLLAWLVNVAAAARMRRNAERVDEALSSMHIGLAVWDNEDRLVECNEAFRAIYPEIREHLTPGVQYRRLLEIYYPLAPAEVTGGRSLEQFVADAMRRRGARATELIRHQNDRWLMMTDARSADGGIVSFRLDITEQRLLDLELRKQRKVMDDLAELSYDWYWRQDAEGRFVEFSAAVEQHLRYPRDALLGRMRTELPGFQADPGELAAYLQCIEARQPFPWFRFRATRGDGTPIWVAVTGKPVFDENGAFDGYYGAGRDVTDSEATIIALRASEERFRALTKLATEWYWETDDELRFSLVKGPPELAEALQDALLGKSVGEVVRHPEFELDWPKLARHLERREAFRRVPFRLKRDMRGRPGYFEVSAEPMFDGESFVGFRGLVWDVTEREALIARLTDSEARFRALTELSSDWFWEMDASLRFTSIRRGAHGAFDLADDEVIGKQRWELPGELIQPATWDEHRATLEARKPFRDLMLRHVKADGSVVYHISSGDPVFDENGEFRGYRGVGKNITEQVRAQERIERLATVDPLTQLLNRQTFDERAGRILASAYAEGRRCALLFLDLDNFRLLNNGYGHRVGDQMLSIVASRMRSIVAEPNLLGRRGGDEMVILLTDLPRPEIATETAQALIRAIAEPARVFGMEVSVTPSVGIAFFPQDGADIDSLLNAADAAMYQAKESGRRTYSFFTPSVARRVDLRLRLEQRLRKAVEARDFKLFYQPLVSLVDGKMIGAEALIRWKDVELGDISPAEFIPIAEESGLIIGLGDWVLREACRARQVWRQLGLDVPPLALNMSGVQLRQLGCVESLLQTLAEFEVAPSEVEVEVTETALLDTTAVSRENLIRMRNAGVKLALDDFGVGFSSLSHLRDLPIHRLKIDRSFTVECMRDARTLTIVKAVIEMARSLGISVTAEGIETQAQQTWMQHLGCDTAQGYLFARPMPAEEFLKIFIDRRGVGRERSLMH